jgi:glycosyltransferase involved in cell wall biosynthesis
VIEMERKDPLVSIVIPTFNRPDYLRLALATAVKQTYGNLEIIVHDNDSPQDIGRIVAEFNDPRIRYTRNDKNIGQTRNILAAIKQASGKYLALLGDDDLWKFDFVTSLIAPMEAHPNVVVCFCDHEVIDADGRVDTAVTEDWTRRFGRRSLPLGFVREFEEVALVHRAICIMSGALIRREALSWSAIPEALPSNVDVFVAYLLIMTGMEGYYVPRRLMQYRRHPGQQMTADYARRNENRRWHIHFWAAFAQDHHIKNRAYFKCVCARKALMILLSRIAGGNWDGMIADLRDFYQIGLYDPRVVYYHVYYLIHLRRRGSNRLIP